MRAQLQRQSKRSAVSQISGEVDPNDRNFRTFSPEKHNLLDFSSIVNPEDATFQPKFSGQIFQLTQAGQCKRGVKISLHACKHAAGTGIATLASSCFFLFLKQGRLSCIFAYNHQTWPRCSLGDTKQIQKGCLSI